MMFSAEGDTQSIRHLARIKSTECIVIACRSQPGHCVKVGLAALKQRRVAGRLGKARGGTQKGIVGILCCRVTLQCSCCSAVSLCSARDRLRLLLRTNSMPSSVSRVRVESSSIFGTSIVWDSIKGPAKIDRLRRRKVSEPTRTSREAAAADEGLRARRRASIPAAPSF